MRAGGHRATDGFCWRRPLRIQHEFGTISNNLRAGLLRDPRLPLLCHRGPIQFLGSARQQTVLGSLALLYGRIMLLSEGQLNQVCEFNAPLLATLHCSY